MTNKAQFLQKLWDTMFHSDASMFGVMMTDNMPKFFECWGALTTMWNALGRPTVAACDGAKLSDSICKSAISRIPLSVGLLDAPGPRMLEPRPLPSEIEECCCILYAECVSRMLASQEPLDTLFFIRLESINEIAMEALALHVPEFLWECRTRWTPVSIGAYLLSSKAHSFAEAEESMVCLRDYNDYENMYDLDSYDYEQDEEEQWDTAFFRKQNAAASIQALLGCFNVPSDSEILSQLAASAPLSTAEIWSSCTEAVARRFLLEKPVRLAWVGVLVI